MRTSEMLTVSMLGVLLGGCQFHDAGVAKWASLSEFTVVNASADTILVVVQGTVQGGEALKWIPPGLSRTIATKSGQPGVFSCPDEALDCLSVYSQGSGLLIYQQTPIDNASWDQGGSVYLRQFRLTLTGDSLQSSGIEDACEALGKRP